MFLEQCRLPEKTIGEGENGVVFKACSSDKAKSLDHFKKEFLILFLLETRNNVIPYINYNLVKRGDARIAALVMKLYKSSLEEFRHVLSPLLSLI